MIAYLESKTRQLLANSENQGDRSLDSWRQFAGALLQGAPMDTIPWVWYTASPKQIGIVETSKAFNEKKRYTPITWDGITHINPRGRWWSRGFSLLRLQVGVLTGDVLDAGAGFLRVDRGCRARPRSRCLSSGHCGSGSGHQLSLILPIHNGLVHLRRFEFWLLQIQNYKSLGTYRKVCPHFVRLCFIFFRTPLIVFS